MILPEVSAASMALANVTATNASAPLASLFR
jgi:hypothetical protein